MLNPALLPLRIRRCYRRRKPPPLWMDSPGMPSHANRCVARLALERASSKLGTTFWNHPKWRWQDTCKSDFFFFQQDQLSVDFSLDLASYRRVYMIPLREVGFWMRTRTPRILRREHVLTPPYRGMILPGFVAVRRVGKRGYCCNLQYQ